MTWRRRPVLAVSALSLALTAALAGCGSDQVEPVGTTTTAPAPSPSTLAGVPVQPEPTATAVEGGPEPATAAPADERAALDAARSTMDVWVQGGTLDQMTWHDHLDATLTPQGQQAYDHLYGYRISDTAVTETALLRANAGSAAVRVSTDVATYEVTVVKTAAGWQTSAVTPIAGGEQ